MYYYCVRRATYILYLIGNKSSTFYLKMLTSQSNIFHYLLLYAGQAYKVRLAQL